MFLLLRLSGHVEMTLSLPAPKREVHVDVVFSEAKQTNYEMCSLKSKMTFSTL